MCENLYVTFPLAILCFMKCITIVHENFSKGVWSFKDMYHYYTCPELGINKAALRREPCNCTACDKTVRKPWVPERAIEDKQPCSWHWYGYESSLSKQLPSRIKSYVNQQTVIKSMKTHSISFLQREVLEYDHSRVFLVRERLTLKVINEDEEL